MANVMTVKFKDFDKLSNWSPEYQIGKKKGLKPYKKIKGGKLEEVDENKSIPKDAIYAKDTDIKELNKLVDEINIVKDKYNNLFNNIINKYK